ncbi:CoA transferase [Paraburkholderia sediminicola]|uniref:CoA transferase n=1 Tax=Paraburkholderia sediminicola TaxID=458836 RepID=UPI0038BCF56A
MERLGLHPVALTERARRLVYGQVNGFGQIGPASLRLGLDIAAQAESSMMSINGDLNRDPMRVGSPVVDVMAASTLTSGVLAALVWRSVSSRGGVVNISLIDVAASALSYTWAEYRLNGVMPLRSGNVQPNIWSSAEVMPTADGKDVISAYTKEHFSCLCDSRGLAGMPADPRFSENKARLKNRAAMLSELHVATRKFTSVDLCERLTQAGVVVGAVRTMAEVGPGKQVSQPICSSKSAHLGASPRCFQASRRRSRAAADMGGGYRS